MELQKQKLSTSLQENLAYLQQMFGSSSDFYTKQLTLGQIPCAIALFTGISSPEKLWVMALDALERCPVPTNDGTQLLSYLLTRSVIPAENSPVKDTTDLIEKLANGMSVLLIDGCPAALAVSTQEMPQRSISQPNGEGDIRGSQEAFTELLRNNISLLRRQFRTGSFVAEEDGSPR